MEIVFNVILIGLIILCNLMILVALKGIKSLRDEVDLIQKQYHFHLMNVAQDLDALQVDVAKMSQQLDALPDVMKEDNYRSLLALRESLESTKPIKPNNWDSVREAFKGPTRTDLNE